MKSKKGILTLLIAGFIFILPFKPAYAYPLSEHPNPLSNLTSGSFVITSDPQFPWTDKTDRNESESPEEKIKPFFAIDCGTIY
ncbi:hypothetical protein ACT7DZ_00190 [Bacillus cereus]